MRAPLSTLFFVAASCFGQESFEVASIRPNPEGSQGSFSEDISPNGVFTARNLSLWNMIRFAFNLTDLQIFGAPAWVKTQGFDVRAQPPAGTGPVLREQTRKMLQSLLIDRFQLKAHSETREIPAYALIRTNGEPKLPPPSGEPARTLRAGNLNSASMTLASLCQMLEFELERPVVDRTGLSGSFTIKLQWASERVRVPDPTLPSLFTAVQEQLGLKIESARVPVEVFVIESVQQPSEN